MRELGWEERIVRGVSCYPNPVSIASKSIAPGQAVPFKERDRFPVSNSHEGFDTIQPHFGESVPEYGKDGFAHQTLPPIPGIHFVSDFCPGMFLLPVMKAAGPNDFVAGRN